MPWQTRTIEQRLTSMSRSAEQRLTAQGHMAEGAQIAANSVLGVILKELAGQISDLDGHLAWRGDQLQPDTSELELLERHAGRVNIFRKPATLAYGDVTVTGVEGAVIPAGTRLQASAAPGVVFTSRAETAIAGGTATLTVDAGTEGAIGNLPAAAPMSLVVPVAGIAPAAVAAAEGITRGVDAETDAQLLSRLLFRKRNPPRGGKPADYVRWTLEVAGIVAAWAYETEPSRGYVTVRFLLDPAAGGPIPTEADRLAVLAHLNGHEDEVTGQPEGRPAGMEARAVLVDAYPIDYTIALDDDTPANRAAVEAELAAQLLLDGAPAVTVRVSRQREAVSRAAGETYHRMTVPAADIALGVNQYPVVGAITWEPY